MHSWEQRAATRTWEQRGAHVPFFENSDAEEEAEPDPEGAEAGDVLGQTLLNMLLAGKMSAKSLCTISYWATRAGAQGGVTKFALSPDSQSGKFQQITPAKHPNSAFLNHGCGSGYGSYMSRHLRPCVDPIRYELYMSYI